MNLKPLANVEVSTDQVSLFHGVLQRPQTVTIAEWLDLWEKVKEMIEDEDFGANV